MRRLLIIALLALPLSIQAQRIHAYVTSGVTMSQIEGDELKGFKKVGFNGGVGALTAISHNGRWGLSLEAMYAQRGAYNGTGDPYSIKLTLDYIEIPLLVHFQDPYGGMLFGIGLDYGRLVQQPHNIMQYNPNYFMPDTVDFSFLSDDLSVVADARFTIWRGWQLDIRWQHSLLAVKRQWNFSEYRQGRWYKWDNNCYNHSLTFRLIYQF
ncbi:MAG: outer membrane beta-barrel protein [Bacteroidales bacterium]|nr:outer membrane beta-barrel protein [Bacteroidales bacterium]